MQLEMCIRDRLTSVGRRLNWCGRQYHVMRYGECYVALRSQRDVYKRQEYMAALKDIPTRATTQKINHLLDILSLSDVKKKKIFNLSRCV